MRLAMRIASNLLSRFTNLDLIAQVGVYIAMTGARLRAADLLWTRLVRVFAHDQQPESVLNC